MQQKPKSVTLHYKWQNKHWISNFSGHILDDAILWLAETEADETDDSNHYISYDHTWEFNGNESRRNNVVNCSSDNSIIGTMNLIKRRHESVMLLVHCGANIFIQCCKKQFVQRCTIGITIHSSNTMNLSVQIVVEWIVFILYSTQQ